MRDTNGTSQNIVDAIRVPSTKVCAETVRLAEELRNAREHFVELLASLWPVTGTEHWEQITGSRGKERTEVRF